MKRLMTAAALAVVFHCSLLGVDMGRFFDRTIILPKSTAVTVTMSYRRHEKAHEIKNAPIKRPKKKSKKMAKIPDKPRLTPPEPASAPDAPEPPSAEEKPETIETDESEKRSSEEEIFEDDKQGDAVSNMQVVQEAVPLYRNNPPPKYPRTARKRGYEGTVILSVFIDEDGQVENLWVFESSGYRLLDNAAVKAVRNWAFEPGMKGNRKVAMWVKVPIRFELK